MVGECFTSVIAMSQYRHVKTYATHMHRVARTLKSPPFAAFLADAHIAMRDFPVSFIDILLVPGERVSQYLTFLDDVAAHTSVTHPDVGHITAATTLVSAAAKEVQGMLFDDKNFETLQRIQASFVMNNRMRLDRPTDQFLHTLASKQRRFMKEGNLVKVGKKERKIYRFWLFNDCVLYGTVVVGETFSFHSALDLRQSYVCAHNSPPGGLKHAFELFTAEKSLLLVAPSPGSQSDWIAKIEAAQTSLGIASPPPGGPAVDKSSFAPLWVPNQSGDVCNVCEVVSANMCLCVNEIC